MNTLYILTLISVKCDLNNFQIILNRDSYNKLYEYIIKLDVDFKESYELNENIFNEILNFEDFIYKDYNYIGYELTFIKKLIRTYEQEFKNQFSPCIKGPVHSIFTNFYKPIAGRTVDFDGCFFNLWYPEFGLFKKIDYENFNLGFYNPTNGLYMMGDEVEFERLQLNREKFLKMKRNSKIKFIRVISVYDKKDNFLKYHILNDFFSILPISNFIDFYENDELYLRPYEITQDIYNDLKRILSNTLEFDFKKNSYFFETLSAKDLINSYSN